MTNPLQKTAILAVATVSLVGCSVVTEPLSVGERQQLMSDTLNAVHRQKLEGGKISLYEAMRVH